jgi:hypothetical protein
VKTSRSARPRIVAPTSVAMPRFRADQATRIDGRRWIIRQ